MEMSMLVLLGVEYYVFNTMARGHTISMVY